MRAKLTSVFLFVSIWVNAQVDTIRLMQYNLLNYGNYTSYCTSSNNNIDDKDDYLKSILDYVQPDVFTVNELGVNFSGLENQYAQRILDNTLNVNGVTKYAMSPNHTGGSYLVNRLYYNTEKLVFYDQEVLAYDSAGVSMVREVDFYTLYHNDPDLATHNDTVFMMFVVAHLKAGNNDADIKERASASYGIMEYLDANHPEKANRFMCGDFNVKGDNELAYSYFLTYSPNSNIRFRDPLSQPAYWSGAWDYRHLHTQATHDNTQTGDCPSGGGLDDRFDFILASSQIINGEDGASYIANSYTALGNDANSYNSDLNTTNNTAVPPSIATALFNMSDHLPIIMDVKISKDISNGIEQINVDQLSIEYTNPVKDQLIVRAPNNLGIQNISIYDISGNLVYSKDEPQATYFSIDTEDFAKGTYILNIVSKEGNAGAYKVVKL